MLRPLLAVLLCVTALTAQGTAPQIDTSTYQDLRYRLIGPFRASRTVAGVGIPTQPNVFFAGVHTGGVWKTDDYGRTWRPIFDSAPTGSIGDIGVSWSNPDVIYVGTGEGLHRPDLGVGDGIFKSTDGGKSWKHVGLPDVQQVGRLVVHPTDPNIVFVAGLGHPYGPNTERGIFRTRDGGATWERVFYIDDNTGGVQVEFDPTNPNIVYGSMWEHREGPWENASFNGKNNGLFKSTDGGTTWKPVRGGLPNGAEGAGRICLGIGVSDPNRLYAAVMSQTGRGADGLYRSNDGGETWTLVSKDPRLGLDIRVHPKNPDVVFVGNIAAYRSDDGGKTWTSIKGAPGGDDYQRIWINPLQPDVMLFTADQGAVVTVNGGRTWSSWYNQPTSQLYHVTTDNQFPYWVYGGQQESGAIGIASRGNGGQISFRDWIGVGADEYAYIAPDPLDSNIIYGGRVMRFDRRTGQAQNVAPEALRSGKYRILRTMPLLFHPADPKTLFFATNVLWKTTTGGRDWTIISPDLSREKPEVPESIGAYRTPDLTTMARRGVIYAVSPSPKDVNVIWAGTDDGLVHVTRDGGKTWKDVTPPELRAWDKVSQIDAGHFDANTAYIAVNAIRRDDMRPHIYKTHDSGRTWTRIVSGINPIGPVNVVREDPKKPGLLFAGTEREVVFSADDGASWQSLRMNMPASSIRDLVIKDDDLVIGTHGRSIWIMDNIAPLRHVAEARGREGRLPGLTAGRHARAVEHVLRHAAAARGADGAEPAGRRDPRLLPAAGGEERHPRDRRREQRSHSALCERRPGGADRSEHAAVSDLLDPSAPGTRHQRRPSSIRVGPALHAAARCSAVARDSGHLPRHAERSERSIRPPGWLHRQAHGRWASGGAAADRPHGSAREDRPRRPARADRRITRVVSRVSRAAGAAGGDRRASRGRTRSVEGAAR